MFCSQGLRPWLQNRFCPLGLLEHFHVEMACQWKLILKGCDMSEKVPMTERFSYLIAPFQGAYVLW
ncbi:TPA: hypothetical protein DDW35_13665, partial [Candidatus Sumerlaeota bacterium]|nr:hypothetical protein [Candidatus Sumerlaeota bacterium]